MLTYELHITETSYPGVTNCTSCDNLLVDRMDDMKTTRVQVKKPGKCWPTRHWLCSTCANEMFGK